MTIRKLKIMAQVLMSYPRAKLSVTLSQLQLERNMIVHKPKAAK